MSTLFDRRTVRLGQSIQVEDAAEAEAEEEGEADDGANDDHDGLRVCAAFRTWSGRPLDG